MIAMEKSDIICILLLLFILPAPFILTTTIIHQKTHNENISL